MCWPGGVEKNCTFFGLSIGDVVARAHVDNMVSFFLSGIIVYGAGQGLDDRLWRDTENKRSLERTPTDKEKPA